MLLIVLIKKVLTKNIYNFKKTSLDLNIDYKILLRDFLSETLETLAREGMKIHEISTQTGISNSTIFKYFSESEIPIFSNNILKKYSLNCDQSNMNITQKLFISGVKISEIIENSVYSRLDPFYKYIDELIESKIRELIQNSNEFNVHQILQQLGISKKVYFNLRMRYRIKSKITEHIEKVIDNNERIIFDYINGCSYNYISNKYDISKRVIANILKMV